MAESEDSIGRFFTRIKKPSVVAPGASRASVRKVILKPKKKEGEEDSSVAESEGEEEAGATGASGVPSRKKMPVRQKMKEGDRRKKKISFGKLPGSGIPGKTKRARSKGSGSVFNVQQTQDKQYREWKAKAKVVLPSYVPHVEEVHPSSSGAHLHQMTPSKMALTEDDEKSVDSNPSDTDVSLPSRKRKTFAQRFSELRKTRETLLSGLDEEALMGLEALRKRVREEEKATTEATLKEQITVIREACEPLNVKVEKRRELIETLFGEEGPYKESRGKRIRDRIFACATRMHSIYSDLYGFFTIWERDITEINCRFGVVVSSYFVWLRRILKLNIFTFLIAFFLIIVPEFIEEYTIQRVTELQNSKAFEAVHILYGEGYFHYSYLYYSGYHNRYHDKTGWRNAAIRVSTAILLIFILHTVVLFSFMKVFYRNLLLERKITGMANMDTVKSVICAWDFSCGEEKFAEYLHKMIKQQLHIIAKGMQQEAREMVEIEEKARFKLLKWLVKMFGIRGGTLLMHILTNVMVIICCLAMGSMLYHLCSEKLTYYLECIQERDDNVTRVLPFNEQCPGGDLSGQTRILSLPALFTSVVSLILMKLMTTIGEMEYYQRAENKMHALMLRGGIFNLTSISVFFIYWLVYGRKLAEGGYVTETIFGKEMYRLVVIQGLIDVFIDLGIILIFRLLKTKKKMHFQTEFHAQELFYIDSIARLGTLFCPPICLLVALRLVIDFYLKKYYLLHLSKHDFNLVNASSAYVPYLATFFISYLVAFTFLGVFMTEIAPSQIDGPFLKYTHSYTEAIAGLFHGENTVWVKTLFEPGSLSVMIALLGAFVYMCREWALAYVPIMEEINELILMERADKELLLKAFYEIARVTDTKKKEGQEDQTDEKIGLLIQQARRRRSLDTDALRFLRSKGEGKHHHRQNMENIVKEIVQERKRRKNVLLEEDSDALRFLMKKQEEARRREEMGISATSRSSRHSARTSSQSQSQNPTRSQGSAVKHSVESQHFTRKPTK